MQAGVLKEDQFIFEGLPVAYYRGGQGDPLLLIHGSGPGASSIGNWRAVLGPLSERHEVFAMDLVGFGRSARKAAPPYFDYDLWVHQAEAMLAMIEGASVGVIGHSLSGSLALTLAARNPRIDAVLTTGTMGAPFEATDATRRTWTCPANRDELLLALKGLIFDHSVIDEAYIAAREPVVFAPGYADYFNQMFTGDPANYIKAATLSGETLAKVTCPVALLHGRDDTGFPPSSSIALARQLARADVTLLSKCSHSVAFERPDVFLALAGALFGSRRR
jgi:2-hydroxymuconate-semialdehyde hydrolase